MTTTFEICKDDWSDTGKLQDALARWNHILAFGFAEPYYEISEYYDGGRILEQKIRRGIGYQVTKKYGLVPIMCDATMLTQFANQLSAAVHAKEVYLVGTLPTSKKGIDDYDDALGYIQTFCRRFGYELHDFREGIGHGRKVFEKIYSITCVPADRVKMVYVHTEPFSALSDYLAERYNKPTEGVVSLFVNNTDIFADAELGEQDVEIFTDED